MWLVLTISSYILQAINGAIDRVIVHKNKTSPEIVSFWISIFSLSTVGLLLIGLLPFDFADNFKFVSPTPSLLFLVLAAGVLTQAGLLFMYKALEDGEATRVLSIMGAVTPIVALGYGYLALGDTLSSNSLFAFILLILGAVVLTYRSEGSSTNVWIFFAVTSSVILGIQSVIAKGIFNNYQFISAYALMSLGSVMFGLYLFSKRSVRDELLNSGSKSKKKSSKSSLPLIIFNTIIGGLAVIIFNLAIKLGNPALVNSLRGVQYAFVFVIALALAKNYPILLDEVLNKKVITIKIMGIILVINGIILLAV